MEFKVIKSLVYGGKFYDIGEIVNIQEKFVIESCLEREMIEEKEKKTIEIVEDEVEVVEKTQENTEKIEDKKPKKLKK